MRQFVVVNSEGIHIKKPKNKDIKCNKCGKIILSANLWPSNSNIIHCTCSNKECNEDERSDDERERVQRKACCSK